MAIQFLSPPNDGTGAPQETPPLVDRNTSRVKSPLRLWKKRLPVRSAPTTGSLRKVPGVRTPGNVQVCPPSNVYARPAWRKFDVMVEKCRQAITMLFGLREFTAMDGSFDASPVMLRPAESTFTW